MKRDTIKQIRQSILEKRRNLSAAEISGLSQETISRFLKVSQIETMSGPDLYVGMYRATSKELDLKSLEERLREMGWRILFPRLKTGEDAKSSKLMDFVEVSGSVNPALKGGVREGRGGALTPPLYPPGNDPSLKGGGSLGSMNNEFQWVMGHYGVEEPHSSLEPVPIEKMNLIFVPGVAFGPNGERVGRGLGYYDRFLGGLKNSLRVALAFDFQILPELPQEKWDQPVHWVLSEKREFRSPFVDQWLKTARSKILH